MQGFVSGGPMPLSDQTKYTSRNYLIYVKKNFINEILFV